MLITCDRSSSSKQENIRKDNLKHETNDLENQNRIEKTQKKRFQNLRNNLTKNNRKLLKQQSGYLNSGSINSENEPTIKKASHLQLIVSKCRCEFYMIDFEDKIGEEDEHLPIQMKNGNLPMNLSTSPTPNIMQANGQSNSLNNSFNYSQIFLKK